MIPWKTCSKHDFKYLYGNSCVNCDAEKEHKVRYIIFDQDSILANLSKDWYSLYNAKHDDDLTIDKVAKWEVHEFTKSGNFDVYKLLDTPGLYRNLEPIPGAIEAVKKIFEAEDKFGKRFNVSVISAVEADVNFAEKRQWLMQYLPFLKKRDIGFYHEKQRILTDIFVDDSPANIKAMRARQPLTEILTISYPYNQDVRGLTNLHAESYKDFANAWKEILDYLKVS